MLRMQVLRYNCKKACCRDLCPRGEKGKTNRTGEVLEGYRCEKRDEGVKGWEVGDVDEGVGAAVKEGA